MSLDEKVQSLAISCALTMACYHLPLHPVHQMGMAGMLYDLPTVWYQRDEDDECTSLYLPAA